MNSTDKPLVWLFGEIKTPPFSRAARLEKHGWRIGSADDFWGLTEQESLYIRLKLAFSENLKRRRLQKNLTQVELAKLLKSNQSRIAKMEAGDPSVSIDLLIKSLLALDTTKEDLASMILSEY